jgi:DNA polymerase-3 subunit beta
MRLLDKVVPARAIREILQHVKITADDERCTLMATDLDMGIRAELRNTRVPEAGEALLPAGRFLAILREVTDEEVSIEGEGQSSVVRGQRNEFRMSSEDPAKFPDIPAFTAESCHELAAGTLREMIRRTIFAAAVAEPRFATTGTLWELNGDHVRLVTTDGRRLAVADGSATPHGDHQTNGQTHVVPTKAMKLLERNLQDPDERVRISLRPNEALFKTERATIYSRLIEGRYPGYQNVFPQNHTLKISLDVGPFCTAVRQAAVATDEEFKKVLFRFSPEKLSLQVCSERNQAKVELPISYEGETLDIAFNPELLTCMLQRLSSEDRLTLELVDAKTVGLFRRGQDYSYIVMPMNISEKTAGDCRQEATA